MLVCSPKECVEQCRSDTDRDGLQTSGMYICVTAVYECVTDAMDVDRKEKNIKNSKVRL